MREQGLFRKLKREREEDLAKNALGKAFRAKPLSKKEGVRNTQIG